MAGIVPFLIPAAHLTAVTITGQTVNAVTGVFTPGTSRNLLVVIEELGHRTEPQFEDVRPVTSAQINEVKHSAGNSMRLTTLKMSNSAQALHDIVNTYDYVSIAWTEGVEAFVGYFAVGPMDGGIRGRAGQRVSVDFRPCDPLVPQVSRTVS
jgi:hypothetical protein